MYQKEICLILLGIIALCAILGLIWQKMYLNWLMTGEYSLFYKKED